MPGLSINDLFSLAYKAGFRGNDLKTAVAIALAESGGNPGAYNPEVAAGTAKGSGSRGLWQIYGTAHPEFNSSIAFDPVVNAQAAYKVYREAGGRFTPWSTYTNGMYKSILNGLKIPTKLSANVGNIPHMAIQTATGAAGTVGHNAQVAITTAQDAAIRAAQVAAKAAQNQAGALQSIASGEWLSNAFGKINFENVSFYVGGGVLMIVGLLVLFQKPVAAVAGNAVRNAGQAAIAAAL